MQETGWNVLRCTGATVSRAAGSWGALYRDTWVRTADGRRRVRQEFFPDRLLSDDGKPLILPHE